MAVPSAVAYWTVTSLALPPVRVTVMVALPAPSLTLKALALNWIDPATSLSLMLRIGGVAGAEKRPAAGVRQRQLDRPLSRRPSCRC